VKPLRPDALTPTLSHREREKNEPPSTGRGERRAPFHRERGKTSPLPREAAERRVLFYGERGKDESSSTGGRGKDESSFMGRAER